MLKGNVIVGQSGGPTAVINASLAGVFAAAKDAGVQNIYGMVNGIEGLLKDKILNLGDYLKTEEDIHLLKSTPAAFLGSCRYKLPKEDETVYQKIFDFLKEKEIETVIYIGGNDSMDTILKLSKYGETIHSSVRFIGVPKTVDNDLPMTDHTPGFGSAAKYVATAMKEIIADCSVYDLDAVTIVEIMGRNAGWLTAASVLSKGEDCPGPDLIYLPESPFDAESFLEKVDAIRKKKKTVVVAVSESLTNQKGEYLCESLIHQSEDSFGHKILSGTAMILADLIHDRLGIKARGIVLNTTQRCAAHIASKTDIEEAFAAGKEAIQAAEKGQTGVMIIFERISDNPYTLQYQTYDIEKIANIEKTVPDSFINETRDGITESFITYCRPLILGENSVIYENGLPKHLKR